MNEQTMMGLFAVAKIHIHNHWRIENQYWPDCDDYEKIRKETPWWLVKTSAGIIEIGWRKKVISIDWSDFGIAIHIPDIDDTHTNEMVHAWSEEDAISRLKTIKDKARLS